MKICLRFVDQTLLVKRVKFEHAIHANSVKYHETLEKTRAIKCSELANKVG
jgi:hypothetical protein